MDAEDAEDDYSVSLPTAALAEIELLDAERAADSSSSSDDLETESLALDDASPSSLVLDSSSDASPSRSLVLDSSSPSSPSHSRATGLANEAADADPSVNDDPTLGVEGTPVLTPETDEAASLDDDEEEPTPQTKEEDTLYPRIFAIGDAADAFGALPTGHNASAQGEVAGQNVLRLISRYGGDGIAGKGCEGKKREEDEELKLETYTPGLPTIKVLLGLVSFFSASPLPFPLFSPSLPHHLPSSFFPLPLFTLFLFTAINSNRLTLHAAQKKTIYHVNGTVGVGVTVGKEREDLNAAAMWMVFGCPIRAGEEDGEGMYR
jgi:hypothetical protein